MANSLFYTWKAEEDLASLYRFIAKRDVFRAREFVISIEDRCESLIAFPEQGRVREDLGSGIRILPYAGTVVIAYRVTKGRIEIARIFAGGRDYEDAMKRDRKG